MSRERRYGSVPGMVVDRHRWVYDLLEQEERLEEILGIGLGELLGCGYYGCAIEAEGPWVVKLTVDPSEGPIWSSIDRAVQQYADRTGEYLAAWPRVRDVIELEPGVQVGAQEHRLYAIIREAASPAFQGDGYIVRSTDQTLLKVGLSEKIIDLGLFDPVMDNHSTNQQYIAGYVTDELLDLPRGTRPARRKAIAIGQNVADMLAMLRALREYDALGKDVRRTYRESEEAGPAWQADIVRYYVNQAVGDEVREIMERIEDNQYGAPLARLCVELLEHYIVLADLHLRNIGWRQYPAIDGDTQPECLMVIDPGATPTIARSEVERRMIANGRWRG